VTLTAAVLVASAVLLRWPSGRWRVRRRLGGAPRRTLGGWLLAVGVAAASAAAPMMPTASGPGVVLVGTAAGVTWFAVRQSKNVRRRSMVVRRRTDDVELLGLMAAELRAGILPQRVLAGLGDDFGVVRPAARAAEMGGDVASALRAASQVEGHELLESLAGAWHVADRSGAPLAVVVDRLEQAARVEREIDREIDSGVAPARATARLMAGLPAVGLLLGSGVGGDPVAVLTSTWLGVGCLAVGCGLACAGVAWIERIATSAGRP